MENKDRREFIDPTTTVGIVTIWVILEILKGVFRFFLNKWIERTWYRIKNWWMKTEVDSVDLEK